MPFSSFLSWSTKPFLLFVIFCALIRQGCSAGDEDFMLQGNSSFSLTVSRTALSSAFRGNLNFFGDAITWLQHRDEGVSILSIRDALNPLSDPFIECRLTTGNYTAGEWMFFYWLIDQFNVRCGLQNVKKPTRIRYVADNPIPLNAPQIWRVQIHAGKVQACISRIRVQMNRTNYPISCQDPASQPPSLSLEGVSCGCPLAPNNTEGFDTLNNSVTTSPTSAAPFESTILTTKNPESENGMSLADTMSTVSSSSSTAASTSPTEESFIFNGGNGIIQKSAQGEQLSEAQEATAGSTSQPSSRTKRESIRSKGTTVPMDTDSTLSTLSASSDLSSASPLSTILDSLRATSAADSSGTLASSASPASSPTSASTSSAMQSTSIPVNPGVSLTDPGEATSSTRRFTIPLSDDPSSISPLEDESTIAAGTTEAGGGPVVGGTTSTAAETSSGPTESSPQPAPTTAETSAATPAPTTTVTEAPTTTTSTTVTTEAPTVASTTTTTTTLAPTTTPATTPIITVPPHSSTTPMFPPTLNITSTTGPSTTSTTVDPMQCGAIRCVHGYCDREREECNCPNEEGNRWYGENCNVQAICQFKPCQNGGSCEDHDEGYKSVTKSMNSTFECECASGWSGATCTEKQMSTGAIVALVFCIVIFLCILIAAFFLFRFVRKSRKLKGKYNPAKEELASGNGPPLPMVDINREERLI